MSSKRAPRRTLGILTPLCPRIGSDSRPSTRPSRRGGGAEGPARWVCQQVLRPGPDRHQDQAILHRLLDYRPPDRLRPLASYTTPHRSVLVWMSDDEEVESNLRLREYAYLDAINAVVMNMIDGICYRYRRDGGSWTGTPS